MTPSLLMATTVHETVDAFLIPYVDHFRALGWRVDVLAAGAAGCHKCSDHADTAHETTWARRPVARGNGQAVRQLRGIQGRGGFDIVHVHTPVAALLSRWALRPGRALPLDAQRPRLVYTAHGFHFDETSTWRSRPFELVERVAGAWTDHLVVINDEDHDWASRAGVVPSASLELMPGIGVDLSHYAATPTMARQAVDIRRHLGVPEGAPVFTMVAEFITRKRHVDAIEALARVRDAHLILVGHGPLLDLARTLTSELGLTQRCHIVGRKQDVRPWILAADALLLPSTREGLPRSILEAMALGVPVIGTQIRGTRSLLGDERGFLVPTADPEQLAQAMRRVVEEPQETERRASRALAHVGTYDIRELLRRHELLYEQLLSQRRAEPTTTPRAVPR